MHFDDSLVDSDVNILFWLSIGLWVLALVSYAVILSGNEQLEEKQARMSSRMTAMIPFGARSHSAGHPRPSRHLYRILILSTIGALVTGGLFLLTGIS